LHIAQRHQRYDFARISQRLWRLAVTNALLFPCSAQREPLRFYGHESNK
jgi:hypothetical protein